MVGAVEILPSDLARLDPEEFLNDTIIDFWMWCAVQTSWLCTPGISAWPCSAIQDCTRATSDMLRPCTPCTLAWEHASDACLQ